MLSACMVIIFCASEARTDYRHVWSSFSVLAGLREVLVTGYWHLATTPYTAPLFMRSIMMIHLYGAVRVLFSVICFVIPVGVFISYDSYPEGVFVVVLNETLGGQGAEAFSG